MFLHIITRQNFTTLHFDLFNYRPKVIYLAVYL